MSRIHTLRELKAAAELSPNFHNKSELAIQLKKMLPDFLELVEACEWFEDSELNAVPEEHGLLGSWNAIKVALLKLRGED